MLHVTADIVKFYGCELGAQTKYDKATGTSIVNGAHDVKKLSELLEGFIKRYVQCHSCGNPETQVKIRKDAIFLKCKACGFTSDVDMRHKLNTFILKNPPEEKLSKAEKKCVPLLVAVLGDADVYLKFAHGQRVSKALLTAIEYKVRWKQNYRLSCVA